MADTPNPSEPNKDAAGNTPPAPLTPEQKMARLEAARKANAEKAAAKAAAAAAGGSAPAAAAPAAAPKVVAAPLTDVEKAAKVEAAKAAATPAKAFPPKADVPKDSGVEAVGAPANKPASEHLAAAKTAAAKPAPAKPKEPEGPLPPPPQLQTRRTFLNWAVVAWGVFFVWLAGVTHLFTRFMFPNVLYESDPKFIVGNKSKFPETPKVYEEFKQSQAVWIVRLLENGQDRLVALSTVCTHLGCTPNWLEAERKYKCPCHGSGYYIDGVNFEGPTPRPLERHRIFIDPAGNIVVDKAFKFRKDLDQWNNPDSYINLG
jgi:cytochrome b6-f complex iron-sulfur subunit